MVLYGGPPRAAPGARRWAGAPLCCTFLGPALLPARCAAPRQAQLARRSGTAGPATELQLVRRFRDAHTAGRPPGFLWRRHLWPGGAAQAAAHRAHPLAPRQGVWGVVCVCLCVCQASPAACKWAEHASWCLVGTRCQLGCLHRLLVRLCSAPDIAGSYHPGSRTFVRASCKLLCAATTTLPRQANTPGVLSLAQHQLALACCAARADKFEARFGRRLVPADRDRVLARVVATSQALNAISAAVQQQRQQQQQQK